MGGPAGAPVGSFIDFGFNVKSAIDATKTQRRLYKQDSRQFKETTALNTRGYELELRSINQQTLEGREQLAQQIEDIVSQTLGATGATVAAAGRGGVAGQAVADSLDEVERQASLARGRVGIAHRFRERSADIARAAARNNLQLRNIASRPGPTVVPDLTTALLRATGEFVKSVSFGAESVGDMQVGGG